MERKKLKEEKLETLRKMQKPCRSKGGIFTDRSRLDAIETCLMYSPYRKIFQGKLCDIYTTESLDVTRPVVLVSSHVDIVPDISKCFLFQEGRKLYGTFDNSITNATCVNLMKYHTPMPQVVFAFTGDEETGGCGGAKETVEYLTKTLNLKKENILPVALDVTYEGYDEKKAFTIENVKSRGEAHPLFDYMTEKQRDDYLFVPIIITIQSDGFRWGKRQIPANVPSENCSKGHSWMDEGVVYEKLGCRHAFSFCIPVAGQMHSDLGCVTRQKTFFAYERALGELLMDYPKELWKEPEREQEQDSELEYEP